MLLLAFGAGCASTRDPEPIQPSPVATPTTVEQAPATPSGSQLDLPSEPPPSTRHETTPEPPAVSATPAATPVPVPAPTPEPSADDVALDKVLREHYAVFGQRDWTAFEAHFWPKATIVTIRPPPSGGAETVVSTAIEDYVAEMCKVRDATRIDFELAKPAIEKEGVVALARVAFVARTLEKSEPHPWRGADVFLLVRHDGQWRIATLAFGSPSFDQ